MTKLANLLNIAGLARKSGVPILRFAAQCMHGQSHMLVGGFMAFAVSMPINLAYAGSVTYSYDALARVTKIVYGGASPTTITYAYDATGNWTTVITTTP